MKSLISLSLSLLFLSFPIGAIELNDLQFLTEEYPPYNFTQDGEKKGISVDLLAAAARSQGIEINKQDIEVSPWARAYRTALIEPDTVLFSTTRTKLREHLFKWVGPLSSTRIVVLAKKSRKINIKNSKDFAQYRIGVIRDDVGEQLMLELGVPRGAMQETSMAETLAKQLAKDCIDLWAYEENVANWWIKQIGYDTGDFEVIFVLREGELYYAFNLAVDDQLVEKLQRGIHEMKSSLNEAGVSKYQEIVDNYR